MATLELQGLTKRFGEFTAVDSMNLKAAEGEMIALLGGSGCGKTTTLRMIAGSTDPAAVKAALPGVTYTGVTGDIAFDDIGDAIRDTAYIKVADTANNAWALETMQKAG